MACERRSSSNSVAGAGDRDVAVPVPETLEDQFGLATAGILGTEVPDEGLREVPLCVQPFGGASLVLLRG